MTWLAGGTPMLSGETMMSWVARVARDETDLGPFEFLNLIGVGRKEILDATDEGIDRLAGMTGVPGPRVAEGAYIRIGERFYQHRGQRFHAEFAGRDRTTYCPACLLDDAKPAGPSRGRRVGRVNWLFDPVRTCRIHGIALIRTTAKAYADRFQDMDQVAPDDDGLQALVANAAHRTVSPLQIYVENRFDGCVGPEWLDGQQIDQASRACEILGAIIVHGSHVDLPDLSDDDWDRAGAVGFAFTSRGEEGIREALDRILRRFQEKGIKGGPQAVYGRLFQWIQFQRSGKSRGPIREVLRQFILDNLAIDPGTSLLGEIVERRSRHSVDSLAKQTGLNRKTLNRALVMTGILPEGDPNRVDGFLSFDAGAGECLAKRLKGAIPVTKIPAYLKCNRMQAQALARSGLIGRIGGVAGFRSKNALTMISTSDLDGFLAGFRANGAAVTTAGHGMRDVIDAATISRWPVIDIVRLVFDGGLSRIELLSEDLRFRSVLVDPEEVRSVLQSRQARGRLSVPEAAARLGIPTSGIRALMSEPDRDGRPFLHASIERCGQGVERAYFAPRDLDRYAAAHADLKKIAKDMGVAPKILRGRLSAMGVEPILPRSKMQRLVYRRGDIQ